MWLSYIWTLGVGSLRPPSALGFKLWLWGGCRVLRGWGFVLRVCRTLEKKHFYEKFWHWWDHSYLCRVASLRFSRGFRRRASRPGMLRHWLQADLFAQSRLSYDTLWVQAASHSQSRGGPAQATCLLQHCGLGPRHHLVPSCQNRCEVRWFEECGFWLGSACEGSGLEFTAFLLVEEPNQRRSDDGI